MADTTPPPPPAGYESWLDFAVATMDTRDAQLSRFFEDSTWVDRDECRKAALAELNELRRLAKG
jgi:hypothetical protein